jgi:hypothetical protein
MRAAHAGATDIGSIDRVAHDATTVRERSHFSSSAESYRTALPILTYGGPVRFWRHFCTHCFESPRRSATCASVIRLGSSSFVIV